MKRHQGLFVLAALGLAILMAGCWGSDKSTSVNLSTGQATNVGDTICEQCHSATLDPLTQESIVVQYERSSPHKNSAHANNGNGCEACHGSGSLHYGQGPIPYPNPFDNNGTRCADCHNGIYATDAPTKFATSNHGDPAKFTIEEGGSCRRCHSHEGAVLGNIGGLTGNKEIMDNPVNQGFVPFTATYSALRCSTCHEHGAGLRLVMARDNNSNLVNWNPDKNQQPGQFDLCTSCHTMYDYTGNNLLASGTAEDAATLKPATMTVGHHETSWYRIIATTHFDNPATTDIIEGYNVRKFMGEGVETTPCFDCHGHEAYAGTRRGRTTTPTIYTDWAQSGHGGGLLKAKYAAADNTTSSTTDQVDSVMISGVAADDSLTTIGSLVRATNEAAAWVEDDWDNTLAYSACQRCHTATGASNYLKNPAAYVAENNTFLHLSGWTNEEDHGNPATFSSPQNELLYCWGCHRNAAKGLLWTPGAITAPYKFTNGVTFTLANAVFPAVDNSNICISCHSGRESGETIAALDNTAMDNVSFKNSHYFAVAGLMYVKIGYTGFIALDNSIGGGTTTYGQSLTSFDDGGALTSTHRKLGTTAINGDSHNAAVFTPGNFDSNGPCVTCHMQGTGQPTRSTSHTWEINWNAFNEVCIKCHDEEGGVPLDSTNFNTLFIEEQAIPFNNALAVAADRLLANYNISYVPDSYPYFLEASDNTTKVTDWTRGAALSGNDAKKLMGACFNINLLTKEPAAYVHARTYARRLLYDTIDFLDDQTINFSTGATAIAYDPVMYVRGPLANDNTTTESYKYLAGYSRSTGAWNAIERP